MSKGKRLFRTLTVCILLASMTISANATGLQSQEQQLENQRDEVKKEQETLAARVQALTTSMQNAEAEISAKELEIERTEEELLQAKIEQNRQYESMKLRMQYMYENGNESYLEILIGSESIIDFFTKAEYIATMSQYDRKKLDEFTMIVHLVEEKELDGFGFPVDGSVFAVSAEPENQPEDDHGKGAGGEGDVKHGEILLIYIYQSSGRSE